MVLGVPGEEAKALRRQHRAADKRAVDGCPSATESRQTTGWYGRGCAAAAGMAAAAPVSASDTSAIAATRR